VTADAEPAQTVNRSGSAVRSLVALVAWYGAALLALGTWLGPELARPDDVYQPARPCTQKTLACFQWTPRDTIEYLVVPILITSLAISLVTLAVMVRRGRRAMTAGTVAAFTGWLTGPVVLLLLILVWAVAEATLRGLSR
jgi:hypothetical protein